MKYDPVFHDRLFHESIAIENRIATDDTLTPKAAEAVAPGFDFPFYGHVVSKFYITTHGFLSFAPRNGCQLLRCDEINKTQIVIPS